MSDQGSISEDEQFICFDPSSLGPLNQLSSIHWDKITKWLELIETEAIESLYQFQYGHVIGPFSTPNLGVLPDSHISSPVALDEFIAKNHLHQPVSLNPAGPTICMYNAGGRKVCGKIFAAKSSYWRHLYGVHTGAAMPHWRKKGALPQEYRLEAFRAELLFILQGRWVKVTDIFLEDIPVVDQCTLRLAIEICLGVQKHSSAWAQKHAPILCRTKPILSPPSPIIPTPPKKRKHCPNPVQPIALRPMPWKEHISTSMSPNRVQAEPLQEERNIHDPHTQEDAGQVQTEPKQNGKGYLSRIVSGLTGFGQGRVQVHSSTAEEPVQSESELGANSVRSVGDREELNDQDLGTEAVETESAQGVDKERLLSHEEQQAETHSESEQAGHESIQCINSEQSGKRIYQTKSAKFKSKAKSGPASVQTPNQQHSQGDQSSFISISNLDQTQSEPSRKRQRPQRATRKQGHKYSK